MTRRRTAGTPEQHRLATTHGLVVETAPGAGTKVIVRVPKFAPGVHA